jgi:thiol-disulfide isomerase/thioredoxin
VTEDPLRVFWSRRFFCLMAKTRSQVKANIQTRETSEDSEETQKRRGSRDMIRTVTSGTFNALVLEGEGRIAVEFMSYGCAHCQTIGPVLQQVAENVKSNENILLHPGGRPPAIRL